MQTDATLLDVTCCVRLYSLLHVVAQSLKPVKRLATPLLRPFAGSVSQIAFQRFFSQFIKS